MREWILGNESTKNNFFNFLLIIIVGPGLFYLFDVFKKKPNVLVVFDGQSIDKRTIQLKYFEYEMRMNQLSSILGQKKAKEFMKYFLNGASVEEFVLNDEIKNAFLFSYFTSLFNGKSWYLYAYMDKIALSGIENLSWPTPCLIRSSRGARCGEH